MVILLPKVVVSHSAKILFTKRPSIVFPTVREFPHKNVSQSIILAVIVDDDVTEDMEVSSKLHPYIIKIQWLEFDNYPLIKSTQST